MTDPPPDTGVTLRWLLGLDRLDRDLFRAPSPLYASRRNLFGGQVAAQSLRAAAATAPEGHLPHSYHLYFLRPGRNGEPVLFYVSRVRDGRSFTTRTVVAQQEGEAILTMSVSFHVSEPGVADYEVPRSDVAGPDEAVAVRVEEAEARQRMGYAPFEVRRLANETQQTPRGAVHRVRSWMRMCEPLGDDPVEHACAFAYMSDTATGDAPMAAAGFDDYRHLMMTSLDHGLHFHRPIRADEWALVEFEAVSVGAGRGFSRGTFHGVDGRLAASVQQELLMRPLDDGRHA